MFAKPFSLILVFVLTIFNMLILASPIIATAAPFVSIHGNVISMEAEVYYKIKFAFFFTAFLVSFL